MREITLILPHYRNLGMLAEQQAVWAAYPAVDRGGLHVIVVDDCSPKDGRPSRKSVRLTDMGSFRLFRIQRKVRWNWLACRNLGVEKATTEWVLLTDIDHVLPAETCHRLLTAELDPQNVYRLSRVDAPHAWPWTIDECPVRETKRVHPNTWLMTRDMYDAIGGYDERLSGCYGTDGEFKDRVNATASAVVLLPDVMVRYSREVLPDASTVGFTRKNDPDNDDDLRTRRAMRERDPDWKPLRLTFPYERVL